MYSLPQRQKFEAARKSATPQSAKRAAKRRGRPELIGLVDTHRNLFASSKHGEDYSARLDSSMARYVKLRESRSNLFAVVMPAGHGKTYYAQKYGFVDVDTLITPQQHNQLVDLRVDAMVGRTSWTEHNNRWSTLLNRTLDLFDYSRPVILLLHHEETALELGAIVLGALRLNTAAFEVNISMRTLDDQFFSRQSYKGWDVMKATVNMVDGLTNRELEKVLIKLLCVNNLPVAAPCKFEHNSNNQYAVDCPMWVLEGREPHGRDVDIAELVDMYDRAIIPKEAVDYYVKQGYTKTSLDFGSTLCDWAPLMALAAASVNEPTDFNVEGDMMDIFPPREAKEANRANITLRRLDETFGIFQHDEVYSMCKYHVGEPHVFVASIVAAWKSLLDQTNVAHIMAPLFCVGYHDWTKVMKELHTLIRTSRFFMNTEISESERQRLMYLDLLVGRASYVINEMSEVDKRGGDTYESQHMSYDSNLQLFTRAQYKKDFPVAIKAAYSRMKYSKQPKLKVKCFREFYNRRKEWLTKGSLVYNHLPPGAKKTSISALDSVMGTIIEMEARHNKQSLFEEMTLEQLLKYVGDKKDFNSTKTAMKYETGRKDRILLPGTLIHFVVTTYVLELAERLEQVGSVRLNAASDDDFFWFDRKLVTGLYHVLYDWADFNEQHSADEMALVIDELENSVQSPADYTYFVQAVVESMYDMHLHDRDGKKHKLWKGLFSGWRDTTWVNTVLNCGYMGVALMSFERIYGYNPIVYLDHGGDDVDGALGDAISMVRFMSIMDAMLFNANIWKQMFSTRSEFFRNTITSGRAYASPTRALASFCAGDWEGSGNLTMRERVTNILDQVGKMSRRGISHEFANGLGICALTHWCKLRIEDSWVSLPDTVLHGREEDGGLGVPDWEGQIWELDKDVPAAKDTWLAILKPSKLSSTDYVAELASDINALSLELARREQLANKLAEDAYDVDLRLEKFNWAQVAKYDGKVVNKIPVIEAKCDDALFDDFLYFKVSDDLMRKYAQASRFAELAGHIEASGRTLSREEIVDMMGGGKVRVEAIDFGGNPYYRRLVPDFMGQKITYYCREAINCDVITSEGAGVVFETLCYMASQVFGHRM